MSHDLNTSPLSVKAERSESDMIHGYIASFKMASLDSTLSQHLNKIKGDGQDKINRKIFHTSASLLWKSPFWVHSAFTTHEHNS